MVLLLLSSFVSQLSFFTDERVHEHVAYLFLDRAFAHVHTQLEQLASHALSPPEPIVPCHVLGQGDGL